MVACKFSIQNKNNVYAGPGNKVRIFVENSDEIIEGTIRAIQHKHLMLEENKIIKLSSINDFEVVSFM